MQIFVIPIFLLCFFSFRIALAPCENNLFIIWNVGQGSWITKIDLDSCFHFDAGGEKLPLRHLQRLCLFKKNYLFLSHADKDHSSGLSFLSRFEFSCLDLTPRHQLSLSQEKSISLIPICPSRPEQITEITFNGERKDTNFYSRIYLYKNKVLMPGDSPQSAERRWVNRLPHPKKIRLLVVGHHGSKTSTSDELLSALPDLQMALISARYRKYKHPHPKVVQRLRKYKKNPILTEEWGHVILQNI